MVGATKEVVLTAGAVGTPHLLMLSGIGPKEHLGKLKVSMINRFVINEMSQHMRILCLSHCRATEAQVSLRRFARAFGSCIHKVGVLMKIDTNI